MKRNLILLFVILIILVAGIFVFLNRSSDSPQASDNETNSEIPPATILAGNDPETVGYSFILDFIAAGTPNTDTHEKQSAMRAYEALSTEAQNMVSVDKIELGLLEFLELIMIPDQGASVEDLQADNESASLIVGLNYSGADRELRSINMIKVENVWKVDSVDVLESYPPAE